MIIEPHVNKFGSRLAKALGLPKNVKKFDLHVECDKVIYCTAEIICDVEIDEVETIFIEYDLVKK